MRIVSRSILFCELCFDAADSRFEFCELVASFIQPIGWHVRRLIEVAANCVGCMAHLQDQPLRHICPTKADLGFRHGTECKADGELGLDGLQARLRGRNSHVAVLFQLVILHCT
jgi:hypothetical protein